VLPGLLSDGRQFYQEAQAERAAARLRPAAAGKRRAGKRPGLKETDPW